MHPNHKRNGECTIGQNILVDGVLVMESCETAITGFLGVPNTLKAESSDHEPY